MFICQSYFKSVHEILWHYHYFEIKSSLAELLHSTIYFSENKFHKKKKKISAPFFCDFFLWPWLLGLKVFTPRNIKKLTCNVTFLLFPHLQFVVSNVIIHHHHNVLIRDTILVENLVGMTYIRLAQWEKETLRSNSDIIGW